DVPLSGNGMPVPLPDIAADPPSFDYGVVTIGYIASQAVMVSNQGTADLVINDVQLVNSNCLNFYRLDAPFGNPVALAPGAQMEVMVRFEPKDTIPEPATVDLRISSNDPDEGQLLVPLSGSGTVNLTPPDISVQPLSYDFGMVMPGDTVYKDFRILNEGVGELLVHNMILIDDDMDEFAIVNTGLRFTVAPGDTHWGTIRYAPYDESRDRAFWVIKSNDPDERKVYVRVKGHYCPPCTTG
ncbi:MAG: choice-of-anchor D domain-containing protein, partial [Calditrichaeota bacterium]|nr:choice-of-anchor D domain-containing protein [Calditrichota bacterium]